MRDQIVQNSRRGQAVKKNCMELHRLSQTKRSEQIKLFQNSIRKQISICSRKKTDAYSLKLQEEKQIGFFTIQEGNKSAL
jgi:hypothetical protein